MTRVSVARALHGPEARSLQLGRKEITVASDRAVKAFFEDWKAEQPVEEISYEDALAEERRVLALREDALSPLLKLLERRIDENSWRRHAACRGRPSNLFFPERGFGSDVVIRQAKEICGSCTARDQCLEAHMSTKTGVYGGTTPRERRALRVQRSTERPTKHGMSAYAKGCRCEECRAANAAHAAKYRFPMY
ncbi:MAG: WhiB family transcriptional regulator [Actinomycetia bacterium]|nr:WhiB family transcriptional regulator [Actinomycetes bacterium]